MRTKICGITNSEDAKLIATLYPWAVGFNFSKRSLRYISQTQAKDLISLLPDKILRVGIFIEQSAYEVSKIMNDLNLNLAQVYRDIPQLNRQKCILSLQANCQKEIPPLSVLTQYAYVLIDAPQQKSNCYGGTGQLANWTLAADLSLIVPLILAGGLNPENVMNAIKKVNPFAVDVCSSIEKAPGIKDLKRLKQFLEETAHV